MSKWNSVYPLLTQSLILEDILLAGLQVQTLSPDLLLRIRELAARHDECRRALEVQDASGAGSLQGHVTEYLSSCRALAGAELSLVNHPSNAQLGQYTALLRAHRENTRRLYEALPRPPQSQRCDDVSMGPVYAPPERFARQRDSSAQATYPKTFAHGGGTPPPSPRPVPPEKEPPPVCPVYAAPPMPPAQKPARKKGWLSRLLERVGRK